MSTSAQVNSREKIARQAIGDDSARIASPVESACSTGSAGNNTPCDAPGIRARRDSLRRLSKAELLSGMARARGTERAALLEVLLHLAELDRRRCYLAWGYGSLFEFTVERYRYSRSAAWRRISAARCIARFPRIGAMLTAGELSLSVVARIAKIIRRENADDILEQLRGLSCREAELLVARYRPERMMPDRIRPVFVMKPVAESDGVSGATVSESEAGLAIPPTGADAAHGAIGSASARPADGDSCSAAGGPENGYEIGTSSNPSSDVGTEATGQWTSGSDVGSEKFPRSKIDFTGSRDAGGTGSIPGAAIGGCSPSAGTPERVVVEKRFTISFTVGEVFMGDLARARSLFSAASPEGVGLEQFFGFLLRNYLYSNDPERRHERRSRRRDDKKKNGGRKKSGTRRGANPSGSEKTKESKDSTAKPVRDGEDDTQNNADKRESAAADTERSRYIPQAVRDEVFSRDGGRCTFVGTNGRRCTETRNLQIDHILPFGKGGSNDTGNLRLLCPAHNRFAAEKEYSRKHMEKFYRRE
jgi:5-methylcytosine-specific restriction endonuclease McrA